MGFDWFVLVLLCCLSSATVSSLSSIRSDCQRTCGNLSIPYPFGMGHDPTCFRNKWFNITCDESATPPKAFRIDYEVLDISLEGQVKSKGPIAWNCGSYVVDSFGNYLKNTPYTISSTRNKFIAIGCDTQAYVTGYGSTSSLPFTFGCMTYCSDKASVIKGSCTGIGCCQSSIPPGLTSLKVGINSSSNHRSVSSFNPCSYAFIVEQDQFNFSLSDLSRTSSGNDGVPVVFDWVMGNETCQAAMSNKTGYACVSENSYCYESTNGPGYRCRCYPGYEGNPYVHGGCKDVDECTNKENNNCTEMEICINTPPGSYHCKCPKGYDRDGWNNGTRCIAKEFPLLKVILGNLGILGPRVLPNK